MPSHMASGVAACLLVVVCVGTVAARARHAAPATYDGINWFDVEHDPPGPKPWPPTSESWKSPDATIFVGVAAYRDKRCGRTLRNFFTKAANPKRVFVGVVQQAAATDEDCIKSYCELMGQGPEGRGCPHLENIRITRVSNLEAKGPTVGRSMQLDMMRDEEFCMQTDSHMDVLPEWDRLLLETWGATENEYAVLSTYVHDMSTLGKNINNRHEVPHLCQNIWTGIGMVRNEQAKAAVYLEKPIFAPLWAAGLSFSKCHAEVKAPYDPRTPQIFDGEEFSKFARMWTRGYDTYSPHRSIVVHDYSHFKSGPAPLGWKKDANELRRSNTRLKTLLGLPGGGRSAGDLVDLDMYNLGTKRSLDQLIQFTGIDLRNGKIVGNGCGDLQWVPFERDPEPEVEVGSAWGFAPAVLRPGAPYVPLLDGGAGEGGAAAAALEGMPGGPALAVAGAAAASADLGRGLGLVGDAPALGAAIASNRWTAEVLLLVVPVLVVVSLLVCAAMVDAPDRDGGAKPAPAGYSGPAAPAIFRGTAGLLAARPGAKTA